MVRVRLLTATDSATASMGKGRYSYQPRICILFTKHLLITTRQHNFVGFRSSESYRLVKVQRIVLIGVHVLGVLYVLGSSIGRLQSTVRFISGKFKYVYPCVFFRATVRHNHLNDGGQHEEES